MFVKNKNKIYEFASLTKVKELTFLVIFEVFEMWIIKVDY
jgi:hypothetical protein